MAREGRFITSPYSCSSRVFTESAERMATAGDGAPPPPRSLPLPLSLACTGWQRKIAATAYKHGKVSACRAVRTMPPDAMPRTRQPPSRPSQGNRRSPRANTALLVFSLTERQAVFFHVGISSCISHSHTSLSAHSTTRHPRRPSPAGGSRSSTPFSGRDRTACEHGRCGSCQ